MNLKKTTSTPFYKKKIVLLIGALLIIVLLGKMFSKNNETNTTNSTHSSISKEDVNEKALNEIRKEEKVEEAIITDENVLYVSVKDDGTRRDGYAEYLCQILKENGSTVNWVKITKVGSTNDPNKDNAYGVLLGDAYCK